VRLYEQLFSVERPDDGEDIGKHSQPQIAGSAGECYVEPALGEAKAGDKIQFERTGYFCIDPDSKPGHPVFNRTVTLKDSWAKVAKKNS
jgi:glutaminyl-tRNA synthetase